MVRKSTVEASEEVTAAASIEEDEVQPQEAVYVQCGRNGSSFVVKFVDERELHVNFLENHLTGQNVYALKLHDQV